MILKGFNPDTYIIKLIGLLIGCVIIALGVYFQVVADVVMLPGDSFVRAVAKVTKKEFGRIRVYSDTLMSVIAVILCVVFLHKLVGVREGTIIASLVIGNLVRLLTKNFSF